MSSHIEDYALVGDTQTAALVGKDGSIDWLCLPRFDDGACFAALLGEDEHGRWKLAPEGDITEVTRRYRDRTLVLETDFTAPDGEVRLIDFMPVRDGPPILMRVLVGVRGTVRMAMDLRIRFDYGSVVPWVRKIDGGLTAVGGRDGLVLRSPVEMTGQDLSTVASFDVSEGDRVPFTLAWFNASEPPPSVDEVGDPHVAYERTKQHWRNWSQRTEIPDCPWHDAILRSLLTLEALTYAPTGGICASPTTSLPEHIGGSRNWDYRYCWLRDATFTLHALLDSGCEAEADAWATWLRRAVAGNPEALQIMYGIDGRRRLTEEELPWLPGYEGSAPVRIGNAASKQFQLDVYGETLDMCHTLVCRGRHFSEDAWHLSKFLVEHVRRVWREPDEGIWEVRGPRQHFVHSKVMAWVAVDRWICIVEQTGRDDDEPLDEWKALLDEIHEEICDRGIDPDRNCFVQHYGSVEVDASLLMLPLVGFLPPEDPRILATVAAIEEDLLVDGFVLRYRTEKSSAPPIDGLPPGEGAFLLTTFWLVDVLELIGRHEDALALFERLLELRNDVGLLSEEWDPAEGRMLGNFPQAFSHVGMVNTARNLAREVVGPALRRLGHGDAHGELRSEPVPF
jgi:GH15 family glucan-1,4-alpha-glucosidase